MRRMGKIAAAVGAGAVLLGTVGSAALVVRPDDSVTWTADGATWTGGGTTWTGGGTTWTAAGATWTAFTHQHQIADSANSSSADPGDGATWT